MPQPHPAETHFHSTPYHDVPKPKAEREPTPEELAQRAADKMIADAQAYEKGRVSAGEEVLTDAHAQSKAGTLDEVADAIEKSGGAKVVRDKDGTPLEIVFESHSGGDPIVLDLVHDQFAGRDSVDLHTRSVAQAVDFTDAQWEAERHPDKTGEVDYYVAMKAEKLMASILRGEIDFTRDAAQDILNDPELLKAVKAALPSVDINARLRFETDENGKPVLIISTNGPNNLVIPQEGEPYVVNGANWTRLEKVVGADLQEVVKGAADAALANARNNIKQEQWYAEKYRGASDDIYVDMDKLVALYGGSE